MHISLKRCWIPSFSQYAVTRGKLVVFNMLFVRKSKFLAVFVRSFSSKDINWSFHHWRWRFSRFYKEHFFIWIEKHRFNNFVCWFIGFLWPFRNSSILDWNETKGKEQNLLVSVIRLFVKCELSLRAICMRADWSNTVKANLIWSRQLKTIHCQRFTNIWAKLTNSLAKICCVS